MMNPLVAAALIQSGSKFLGGLFGGGKQTTAYELSPQAQWLFNYYQGQLGKGAPGFITSPITARYGAMRKGIRESMGEGLGPGSGLETAKLLRIGTAEGREKGEASERYQMGLLNALAQIVGRSGVQTTTGRPGFGGMLAGAGEDISGILREQEALKDLLEGLEAMGYGGEFPSIGGEGGMSRPKDWWE